MLWTAAEHSDEENLQYSWLRAVEWINWPSFISQPIVPVLLYFFNWPWVVLSVIIIGHIWRILVPRRFIWFRLADLGPIFGKLQFITCPVMAFLLWQKGDPWNAGFALLWPIAINVIDLLLAPIAFLLRIMRDRDLWVGPIQEQFMNFLGYNRRVNDEGKGTWQRNS